ncbi:polyphosphate kinase 1 [Dyadobacter psychrotolerans]|uniref:Polyphosphate kinase n=1 Tax=Dyadobacter psychrotolerans TaxID=2541721 RepID=A0A4R5E145_9BACT|nr:polyphosphate kinase 1 [Dyadobacter psychrotolerans]TDE17625.1 polyphosphate kinase 1 [Dyadobacter psychrotolerans]
MTEPLFFIRDISWLSFNERVLMEAENVRVPLLERIKFLSIYSSNLDEFYRVRMPHLQKNNSENNCYEKAAAIINAQQDRFGKILSQSIIPELEKNDIHFCYKEDIPKDLNPFIANYFYTQIAGFLHPVALGAETTFFPENNLLYLLVIAEQNSGEQSYMLNIPSHHVKRFVKVDFNDKTYIIFLEDIIRSNLKAIFPAATHLRAFNIKITRDAELDTLEAEDEDLAESFEKQLKKRDLGFAVRFLYEPGLPQNYLHHIVSSLKLKTASLVEGGRYHNLKDLASLPVSSSSLSYPDWPAIQNLNGFDPAHSLFAAISKRDLMVHAPYQTYDTVLRFFNEAVIDPAVEEIYTTLYRVAHDSKIAHALINAARNGKKVTVLVELKARFDEENNITWAKRMKFAGVKIIYSVSSLKVHAKLALIKRKTEQLPYLGLLATGNLNETTARFYTDHILMTANQPMLAEAENLFGFLSKKKKPEKTDVINFRHLLVAQFNLHSRFLALIDREIENSKAGQHSGITIKLNNLEEEVLIRKLYEASNAGVKINLIVRSICRLIPGIKGQSENITLKRIVDRYLEHGRVFIFENAGSPEVFMGSADWMNRNIYRRIEVCFPIYNQDLKNQLIRIISLQWNDTVQAVLIDEVLQNKAINQSNGLRSQEAIYRYLTASNNKIIKNTYLP